MNTLRRRVCEVVETLSRRKVDVCCIQETRYRGGNCRTIKGKDTRYKLYWSGNDNGTAGVGVFVAEEWTEKVFEVQRVSDRIILVKLIDGQSVVTPFCLRMPHRVRRVSMGRLLHWSGQQQHLLQWLQALGAKEMQWAQALEKKTLTTDVHGARELYAPWMADHRRSR